MYFDQFKPAVTVCNSEGVILYMNESSKDTFKGDGDSLIGTNLFDCHNENSVRMIKEMLDEDKDNCYTIEKNGVKKLIYQAPWKENGKIAGMIELSIILPEALAHFNRN